MEKHYNTEIESIRMSEYPWMQDCTYLDHAGTTLYAKSLIERFAADMSANLYGNPHSASPSSMLSTTRVDSTRLRILRFFRADPEQFDIIFVANASAAIKLVGDCLRDHPDGFQYAYHKDAHTSLVGLRELASGSHCFESNEAVERWVSRSPKAHENEDSDESIRVFGYPAQSNMTGARLPLSWCGRLRRSQNGSTYSLLDTAAFCTTAQLDLSDVENAPSFTALSFYKIFGFPDLGALIVRKADAHILQRRNYFGGGTVDMVIDVGEEWHAKKSQSLHDQLEDGTLPFHNIVALDQAIEVHENLYGPAPMVKISRHTCYTAKVLYDGMVALHHFNGKKLCEIYQAQGSSYGDAKTQSPTIAFNLRNSEGGWITKTDVERLAIVWRCHIRTGGVCNPGGIATHLGLAACDMRRNYSEGMRCGNDIDISQGTPTGICRVSLGGMTSIGDVEVFVRFLKEIFVETTPVNPNIILPPQDFLQHLNISTQKRRAFQDRQSTTVYGIQISPIKGGSSWQIPLDTDWEIRETGLAWNHEWCIVHKGTSSILDSRRFPILSSIKSNISLKESLLVVRAVRGSKESSISISLWEDPTVETPPTESENEPPKPRSYESDEISEFFTMVVGIPCTLARFPDVHAQKAKDAHSHGPSSKSTTARTSPPLSTLTITAQSTKHNGSNIVLSDDDLEIQDLAYVRIGYYYFQIIRPGTGGKLQSSGNAELTYFRYLANVFDGSPAAQNPMIRSGAPVTGFEASDVLQDQGLKACVASMHLADFVCPVRSCFQDASSKDEFEQHLMVHTSTQGKSLKQKASFVDALAQKVRGVASQGRRKGKN